MNYVDYHPAYPDIFRQLTNSIHAVVPTAKLEHVGSTSVPGLGGRGTLDVVLLSEPADHGAIVAALEQIGFADVPYGAVKPALTFNVQIEDRVYEILLYLISPAHDYVRGWLLAFRDYMRLHPEEIERYTAVKKAAIAAGNTQPWSYQQPKTPYLIELAQRIEQEA